MEDLDLVYHDQMNAFGFGDLISEELEAAVFAEDYRHSSLSENFSPPLTFNPPPLELVEATRSPTTNCGNTTEQVSAPQAGSVYQGYGTKYGKGKRAITISPSTVPTPCPQNHILAERKRREKVSQHFIALVATVPGLKKTDKTSILAAFIKYLKELQERVATLEKQNAENTPSTDENYTKSSNGLLPEIQARISDKNVLIQIHCEKQKGVLVKALAEIAKLHLRVISSSVVPFGSSILDITVLAQMEEEFNVMVKDLVKNLRLAFNHFM